MNREFTESNFFENNPLPMWVIEIPSFRFLQVNRAAIEHYGYKKEEFLNMTALDIRPEEEKERFLQLSRPDKDFPQDAGVWKHVKKDGSIIDVEIHASSIAVEGRRARLILAHDVTARVQAESELHKSEKLFRLLIEKSSDMKTLATPDGKVLYASPSVNAVLGYTNEELAATPAFNLIHPDDVPGLVENLQNIIQTPGKSFYRQQRLLHKSGTWLWCEGTVTNHLHEPGINALVSNFRDITERKQFENKLEKTTLELLLIKKDLEESGKSLRNAMNIAHMGSWEVDMTTYESKWSDESYKILGTTPEETQPSAESFLSFVHPDDYEKVKKAMDDSMVSFSRFSFEAKILRKDGTIRYIHSDAEYTLDKEGKPVFLQGTMQDITDKRILENNLKSSNKELETFIYKASHDLRGPLASIMGLIYISREEIQEEKALQRLKTIESLAQRLDTSLVKLVHVMSLRDKESNLSAVDMKELVNSILSSVEFSQGFSKIKFSVNSNLTAPFVTDREAMHSIVQNLVENAIRYHDYTKPEREIKINIHKNGAPHLLLQVADNGSGIKEESKEKIFDMFYRGNESSKGSGLGLYIVKATVEKLGGRIEVNSKEKIGATFSVYLPEKN